MLSVTKNKYIILTALFSVFAVVPLLRPEFFATHDMLAPVYRLMELDVCLMEGTPYARWFPDLYGGRGGPFFNYYSPLSYYVAELFHLAGLGNINSVKATFLLSIPMSGVFMYLFASGKVGKEPAILAGVMYMYAPYHLYDIYVRGDLAESFAFVFFPLILYSLDRGNAALGAVSYALLILSHNVSALLFTGFLAVYIVIFRRNLSCKKALIAVSFGLLLSAFYWVPALFEKSLVNIQNVLIFSPKESFLGVYSILAKIGFMPALLALSALVFSKEKRMRAFGLILFGLVFLMTDYSAIFWNLPLAKYVQFPWRLLAIAALVTSIMGGSLVLGKSIKTILFLSIIVMASSFGFIGYSEHIPVSEADITREELKNLNTGLTYGHEYLPKGAIIQGFPVKNDVEIPGQGQIAIQKKRCNLLSFEYVGDGALARINTYYFPGWTGRIDGKRIVLDTDESGLILADIPKGRHKVDIRFGETPLRTAAKVISIFTLIIALVSILKKRR